jgi:hypothetical protein
MKTTAEETWANLDPYIKVTNETQLDFGDIVILNQGDREPVIIAEYTHQIKARKKAQQNRNDSNHYARTIWFNTGYKRSFDKFRDGAVMTYGPFLSDYVVINKHSTLYKIEAKKLQKKFKRYAHLFEEGNGLADSTAKRCRKLIKFLDKRLSC